MRIIDSSWQGTDADITPELAEMTSALVENASAVRETSGINEHGQTDSAVVLKAYTDPLGADRWAVVLYDANGTEVRDTLDRTEAEADYEEQVRGLASCAAPGDSPWWTESDVAGLALTPYTYTVECRADGEWSARVRDAEGVLGRTTFLRDQNHAPTVLEEAAGQLLAEYAVEQESVNWQRVLSRAAGDYSGVLDPAAQAVRVTVSGITDAGETTYTPMVELAPTPVPTAEQIAAYQEQTRRMAEDDERAAADAYAY
jgi:hypothetical protein